MLAAKIDKKKLMEYGALLAVIFAIIIYVILSNFVFSKKGSGDSQSGGASKGLSVPQREIKKFDAAVIEDDKFKSLRDSNVVQVDVNSLETGKVNPFEPKKKVEPTEE